MAAFQELHNQPLNGYALALGKIRQLRRSGWRGFALYLKGAKGLASERPVIKGIYSKGGRDGIHPWMDVEYSEEAAFQEPGGRKYGISLKKGGLDEIIFRQLGGCIPPGGHLMVSYEGRQRIHVQTLSALNRGVPPAATALGYLIFQAGFQLIKNWYLAEGGFEGPRKLWGEKAPDGKWARKFYEMTGKEMKDFLSRMPDRKNPVLHTGAGVKAGKIIEMIKANR